MKRPSSLTRPYLPGAVTGYKHPRCYANADSNCSQTISKEHFISDNLLKRLEKNKVVKIAGLGWQQPETFDLIPRKGLGSNILCTRHNSSLSSYDSEIGLLVETIHGFDQTPSPSNETVSCNGSAIEFWMLKCLVGMAASKNTGNLIRPECVDILFGRKEWPKAWGFYFSRTPEQTVYHTDSLMIETRIDSKRQLILAVNFHVQGLPFVLALGRPDHPKAFGIWRPRIIEFISENTVRRVRLSWDGGRFGDKISLTRNATYSGEPSIWKEWERLG